MRSEQTIGPALALSALLVAAFSVGLASDTDATPTEVALELEFVDINPHSPSHGKKIKLSERYAERGVVLNFLASWCGYCWKELPELQQLHRDGVATVVGVAADEGDPTDEVPFLMSHLEQAKLTIPVLYVPPEALERVESFYDYQILPATYFIDRHGAVRRVLQGKVPFEALRREIDRSLGP